MERGVRRQAIFQDDFDVIISCDGIQFPLKFFFGIHPEKFVFYERGSSSRLDFFHLNFKQRFAAVAGTDILFGTYCCGMQFYC